MAGTLFVTEYAEAGTLAGSGVPVGFAPPITNNNISIASGSVASNAFNANTRMIRVHNDATNAAVWIKIGAAPTAAVTTDARMVANQTEYFQVNPGHKIAVAT